MKLIKTFSADQFARGLESWMWLDLGAKVPVFASSFGDVFLEDSGRFWFLDTVEGRLIQPWETRDALKATLATPEGQGQFLLGGLAMAAEQSGIVLGPTEVCDFVVPPILGGAVDVANLVARDFVVALNIGGQIHQQVKDLPPGTPLQGIKIEDLGA